MEIGPGDGALTSEIINKKPKKLILIEKDFNLVKKLKKNILSTNLSKFINRIYLNSI